MEKTENNSNEENILDEGKDLDSLTPETENFEMKIPAQYKALQDAAQAGTQYVDEIVKDQESK